MCYPLYILSSTNNLGRGIVVVSFDSDNGGGVGESQGCAVALESMLS